MDLVFVLKWVKSVIGYALYIFHLSALKTFPSHRCLGEFHPISEKSFYTKKLLNEGSKKRRLDNLRGRDWQCDQKFRNFAEFFKPLAMF